MYTGGYLNDRIMGKGGRRYCQYAGFTLETQKLPGFAAVRPLPDDDRPGGRDVSATRWCTTCPSPDCHEVARLSDTNAFAPTHGLSVEVVLIDSSRAPR